ncbi:TIGR03943 family protein [Nocardioides panacisoli]|uniref:TIGR03943 family putative permease subunit n=1 Tax=Nocardioides panacisoli TaxID=627624 RepID=UPI001C625EB9|nr:TIGR03943 family protein [Nocardioides panacisoli]QYJ03670.1 TIGR03943 family protein [Nocardioides panacisoli]
MNRAAQALVLTAVGALTLRIGITDEYVRYVNEWMRWPLVASGVLLLLLAFTAVLWPAEEDHPITPVAWVLLLPVVIGLVVQPPSLGSFLAERGVNKVSAAEDRAAVAPLPEGGIADVGVSNFVRLASSDGELSGRTVRLRGFVTSDADGWYVTRIAIRCCAADGAAFRVAARGVEAPPTDQWVEVVGTWVDGTGVSLVAADDPALDVTDLTLIDEPKRPYE